jgi:tRNA-uridine 2-sulfurtransferase
MSTSNKNKKVFVGLSGGVDSAVSAALLKKHGYDMTGVFVRIALPGYPCSAGEDRREALRVAAHLQIPFVDIDLSEQYQKKVFEYSMDAYRLGETPNPDALCNREIKFGLLYDFVMANGADYLATGHYACTMIYHSKKSPDKIETRLLAGKDQGKDQSYFLWAVPGERLRRTLFPVGNLRKSEVRTLAKKFNLPNADRKDSQGLCFLGGVSMEDALMRELAPVPGDILDTDGEVIGTHRGAVLYTMGQRHGFTVNISNTSAEPLYVVGKDIARNSVTVGLKKNQSPVLESPECREDLDFSSVQLRETNWIGEVQVGAYKARFRYRQELFPAALQQDRNTICIQTPESIPLGQSLVLYEGERCLGGGVITQVSKSAL